MAKEILKKVPDEAIEDVVLGYIKLRNTSPKINEIIVVRDTDGTWSVTVIIK